MKDFVLSADDLFGPQALHAYAGAIQAALELDAMPGRSIFTEEERDRLIERSETVVQMALEWQRSPKEVPA